MISFLPYEFSKTGRKSYFVDGTINNNGLSNASTATFTNISIPIHPNAITLEEQPSVSTTSRLPTEINETGTIDSFDLRSSSQTPGRATWIFLLPPFVSLSFTDSMSLNKDSNSYYLFFQIFSNTY